MNLFKDYFKSPIGWIEVTATYNAVTLISYVKQKGIIKQNEISKECMFQLQEYFLGQKTVFDFPLDFKGTEYQMKVWKALQTISCGETCSYSDIAIKIESPKSVRAVGNTNRMNPISIVIPCHRVIGKNNKLVGYAGGLDKKEWLLRHEGFKF